MRPRRYFPLGKAYGEAFCNRTEELKELTGNVENGKHTFLAAPRRYGKSSLCEKAIEKLKLPSAQIDLHVATSEKGIEKVILKGIVDLINQSVGSIEKHIQSVKNQLKNIKPKLTVEAAGFRLELEAPQYSTIPEVIRDAILLVEKLLKKKKQMAILFIDEFQRIVEIAPDMGIEGGIRSAAQETEYLSMIFSGSNRHLIESIFQDEGRPLYKLCKKIKLDRINQSHYRIHLNKASQKMWNQELSGEVFTAIMNYTEQHPYYVNYMCDALWSMKESISTKKDVETIWNMIVEEERSDLLREFFSITETQKKLLIYIACNPGDSVYSIEASTKMGFPSTSVPKILHVLMTKDIVEEYEKKKYRAINPVYKSILVE